MKKFYAFMSGMLLMVLLIACSSDDENSQLNEGNDNVKNEEKQENNDNGSTNSGNDNDSNGNNNEDDNGESNNNNENGTFGDGKTLSLGETGKVESTLGDYEVTFTSFEVLDELGGKEPYDEEFVLVLVDALVEVTGEEPLESGDLYSAKLFNDDGDNAGSTSYYDDSIDKIEGTLEPGASKEGQFIFSLPEGDSYELIDRKSVV